MHAVRRLCECGQDCIWHDSNGHCPSDQLVTLYRAALVEPILQVAISVCMDCAWDAVGTGAFTAMKPELGS